MTAGPPLKRKHESDLDTEPVLLVRSLAAPGDAQYPLFAAFSKKPPTAASVAGCTVGVRFASNLGERDFPALTLGRCMGVAT
jgi:hypothetical protein